MGDVQFLKAEKEDFPAIEPYNEPWTPEVATKRVEDYARYCDIWKIVLNKEIIGFLMVTTSRWYPGESIFAEEGAIKKECRGKGYGRFMIEEMKKIYSKKGYKYAQGLTNIKSEAFKVWKKTGAKIEEDARIIKWRLN